MLITPAMILPILPQLLYLMQQASALILQHYEAAHDVSIKDDDSPVTTADIAANTLIVERLRQLTPDIPVVSEEGDKPTVTPDGTFWLVDPLDGTKSFIRRTGEFTVNIGLIMNHQPVWGAVSIPVQRKLYYVNAQGQSIRQDDAGEHLLNVTPPPANGLRVVASVHHRDGKTDQFLQTLPIKEIVTVSSSLKFCVIAEGNADIYPRFGPTMEWDTAAAHAVLLGAGGHVTTPEGAAFIYNKPDYCNSAFIAVGGGLNSVDGTLNKKKGTLWKRINTQVLR